MSRSFEDLARLLRPEEEVEVAHGDACLLRELDHPPLDLQVFLLGKGGGDLVDHPQKEQVLEDEPVEDGELLAEPDVSEEVACLLVTKALDVIDEPLRAARGSENPPRTDFIFKQPSRVN